MCVCAHACLHLNVPARVFACVHAQARNLISLLESCTPAGHELLPTVVLSLLCHPPLPSTPAPLLLYVACNGTRAGKQQNIRRMQYISTNINMAFISTFKAPFNLETNGTNPLIARTKKKEDIIPGICDMITVLHTRAL